MSPEVEQAMAQVAAIPAADRKKKMTIVVMSGDFDKLFGAFIIGTGGAAMGMEVTMFFTFWGLRAIRKNTRTGKTLFGKMLGVMYGGDISKSNPSHFSFLGMGRWMFGKMMGNHNVAKLTELPIALWDERLSTAAVERGLIEADMRRNKRKEVIDQHAAAYILQGALDRLARLKE